MTRETRLRIGGTWVEAPPHDDRRAVLLARREMGESIREIAAVVGVSVGTVHAVLQDRALLQPDL